MTIIVDFKLRPNKCLQKICVSLASELFGIVISGNSRLFLCCECSKIIAELQRSPIPAASLQNIAAGENVVRDDDLRKNRGAERVVEEGGMRTGFLCRAAQRRNAAWCHPDPPPRSTPVQREADRTRPEFRGAGGHRHGERAAA